MQEKYWQQLERDISIKIKKRMIFSVKLVALLLLDNLCFYSYINKWVVYEDYILTEFPFIMAKNTF